jgi:arabinofuranosyltransferase
MNATTGTLEPQTLAKADRRVAAGTDPSPSSVACSRSPRPSRGQWALLYGSFLISVGLTLDVSSDDPFITLRYAANVVHGYGPVFNPGQSVEGFTSPLHLLFVIGAYLVPGSHALLKVKLLSLVFGALSLAVATRLVRAAGLPRWGVNVALVLLGGSWSLAVSSANGLETTLACLLTTLLLAELVSGHATERPLVAGLASAGLVAVRPEGIFVAACLVVASAMLEPRAMSLLRRCQWFAGALAAQVLIEVARLAYYGQMLPNTYYAKRGGVGTDVHAGLMYLANLQPGVPEILLLAQVGIVVVGAWALASMPFPRRRWLYASAAVVAQVLAIIETGGDWMQGDRFFAPVAPVAAILLAKGVVALTDGAKRRYVSSHALVVVICAGLFFLVALGTIMPFVKVHDPVWESHGRLDDASLVSAGGYPGFNDGVWTAGAAMLLCVPSGSLVADSEIGFAGYERPDLRILDTRGLTDATIAHDAPTVEKAAPGVTDYEWYDPHSVVGARILAAKPLVVLSFDHEPGKDPGHTVLGGSYVLVAQRTIPDLPVPAPRVLALYERMSELDKGVHVGCSRVKPT